MNGNVTGLPGTPVLTKAEKEAARRNRHRDDAHRALLHGRGINWAADITGLPARFVARIARQAGITEEEASDRGRPVPSRWETSVLVPVTISRRADLIEQVAA